MSRQLGPCQQHSQDRACENTGHSHYQRHCQIRKKGRYRCKNDIRTEWSGLHKKHLLGNSKLVSQCISGIVSWGKVLRFDRPLARGLQRRPLPSLAAPAIRFYKISSKATHLSPSEIFESLYYFTSMSLLTSSPKYLFSSSAIFPSCFSSPRALSTCSASSLSFLLITV